MPLRRFCPHVSLRLRNHTFILRLEQLYFGSSFFSVGAGSSHTCQPSAARGCRFAPGPLFRRAQPGKLFVQ
jgi:hypothetical protein